MAFKGMIKGRKQENVLTFFVDIDNTSITDATGSIPGFPEAFTLGVNQKLFVALKKINEAAEKIGVKCAAAFTTNRARFQTFNDMFNMYIT